MAVFISNSDKPIAKPTMNIEIINFNGIIDVNNSTICTIAAGWMRQVIFEFAFIPGIYIQPNSEYLIDSFGGTFISNTHTKDIPWIPTNIDGIRAKLQGMMLYFFSTKPEPYLLSTEKISGGFCYIGNHYAG